MSNTPTQITKNLSQDQKQVLQELLNWLQKPTHFVTVGGYAGTGKTTLIALLARILHQHNPKIKVSFASYTGKAARVLKTQLQIHDSLKTKDSVSTIHALIYEPIVNSNEEITGWKKKEKVKSDLIIIDEASMVDQQIWLDLLSYQVPIIAVGDHGQLPPIKGTFNLMESPQLKLDAIHRQAKDNPIIKLSIMARERGEIPFRNFASKVKKLNKKELETQEFAQELLNQFNTDTLVLCGYNNTRIKLNQQIRSSLGFESPHPTVNDQVICLRNNHAKDIFNGMVGKITQITIENPEWYFAQIEFPEENHSFSGLISCQQFREPKTLSQTSQRKKTLGGDLFDFGYALTVHKAQGSQAQRVILFEERFKQMDQAMWKRWLYTAVTRAIEELYIIG